MRLEGTRILGRCSFLYPGTRAFLWFTWEDRGEWTTRRPELPRAPEDEGTESEQLGVLLSPFLSQSTSSWVSFNLGGSVSDFIWRKSLTWDFKSSTDALIKHLQTIGNSGLQSYCTIQPCSWGSKLVSAAAPNASSGLLTYNLLGWGGVIC